MVLEVWRRAVRAKWSSSSLGPTQSADAQKGQQDRIYIRRAHYLYSGGLPLKRMRPSGRLLCDALHAGLNSYGINAQCEALEESV